MDTPLGRAQNEYWKLYGALEEWHRAFPSATVSRTPYAQSIIWDMIFWAELFHLICGKSQAETEDFLQQLIELLGDAPASPPTQAGSSGNLLFISNTFSLLTPLASNSLLNTSRTLFRTLGFSSTLWARCGYAAG